MRSRPFQQVDVFTATPYLGNPVAVVLDGEGLGDAEMQHFAQWTNLSETTFVLPPTDPARAQGADYRVRIFTPGGELPFAGHPTIGTCHAWLGAGGVARSAERIVQQCEAGLVSLRQGGDRLAFAAPPLGQSEPEPALLADVIAALGLRSEQVIAARMLDNGTDWLGLLLADAETLLALAPDHRALARFKQKVGAAAVLHAQAATHLIAKSNREARAFGDGAKDASADRRAESAARAQAPPALEVRGFAAASGIDEDPVTGSLNAGLAQWLIAEGRLPDRYIAAQGQCVGRDGRVFVERDAQGQVWVGGNTVTCIEGSVSL